VNRPSRSPSPPDQPVVPVQAAPPSAPSESISPSSHAIGDPSSDTGIDDRQRTSTFNIDSNTSNSKSPHSGPTSLGPRKRGLTSDLGPGSDDTNDKSTKRQRGIDGQPQQPPATTSFEDGPHPTFGSGMYLLYVYAMFSNPNLLDRRSAVSRRVWCKFW
jgi:hypothetical protein